MNETVVNGNRWLLDSLDLVASLGDKFQSEIKQNWDPATHILATKPILKDLLDFYAMGFLMVNTEDMDFHIIDCEPTENRELFEEELNHQIENGTFAWSLYHNRPIVVASKVTGKRTMFHVLATKKRVVGMFLGILDGTDQFIPDAIQKLISIVLLNCASFIENSQLYNELNSHTAELEKANKSLKQEIIERKLLESELVQAQKLESIGQLAAGIAHEINSPAQFIGDNIRFLSESFTKILTLLEKYRHISEIANEKLILQELIADVNNYKNEMNINYFLEEIPKAISQSLEGINRVSDIVSAMKVFSHPGVGEKTLVDINKAIKSTITVARNEWKYVAEVVTDFNHLIPMILCYPGEINQVILNIIINAADAIADKVDRASGLKGTITVRTHRVVDWVEICITDTGTGIPEEVIPRIFDPFFTTKEIGKGIGQGLAISHDIVVKKHNGTITFNTEIGKGTSFIIKLPINSKT